MIKKRQFQWMCILNIKVYLIKIFLENSEFKIALLKFSYIRKKIPHITSHLEIWLVFDIYVNAITIAMNNS